MTPLSLAALFELLFVGVLTLCQRGVNEHASVRRLCSGFERCLHRAEPLFDHFSNCANNLVWHQIRNPYKAAGVFVLSEDLKGSIVVREWFTTRGP